MISSKLDGRAVSTQPTRGDAVNWQQSDGQSETEGLVKQLLSSTSTTPKGKPKDIQATKKDKKDEV